MSDPILFKREDSPTVLGLGHIILIRRGQDGKVWVHLAGGIVETICESDYIAIAELIATSASEVMAEAQAKIDKEVPKNDPAPA